MNLKMKNMQIRVKLFLGFLCFFLFYLLLQFVVRTHLRGLEESEIAYINFKEETDNLIANLNTQSINLFLGTNAYLLQHSTEKIVAEKVSLKSNISGIETLNAKLADGLFASKMKSHLDALHKTLSTFVETLDVVSGSSVNEEEKLKAVESLNVSLQDFGAQVKALSQTNFEISKNQESRIQESISSIWEIMLIVGTGGIILVALFFFFMSRSISDSVRRTLEFTKHLEKGEFWAEPTYNGTDEVGDIVVAINNMKNHFKEILRSIDETTKGILSASHEFSSGASIISSGASEQASASAEISSTMESLADGIRKVSNQANETSLLAKNAYLEIENGVKKVFETVNAIEEIAIKNKVIGEISYQTKILSINASVEASRASEFGGGFATVAEEVKRLAESSQESAAVISVVSKKGVALSNESAKMLNGIVPHIKETATLISEIGETGTEQIQGIDQMSRSIGELNNVIQQNAASSEELASSSEELVRTVESLRDQISFFKLEEEFVEEKVQEETDSSEDHVKEKEENTNADEDLGSFSNSFETWLESRDKESAKEKKDDIEEESEPREAASEPEEMESIRYPKVEKEEIDLSSFAKAEPQNEAKRKSAPQAKSSSGLSNSGVRISLADNDDLDSEFEKIK